MPILFAQGPGHSRFRTGLCTIALAALNAYICRDLFATEFSSHMGSVESAYVSISRWAMENWGDLTWFPLWFGGTPFHRVYQPGLHLSVAAFAQLTGWTPVHAFHFVTAIAYCAAPVTLFWLAYRATLSRAFGFVAGAIHSLISPACLLAPMIRQDIGGLLLPRRYQILTQYGEGPHFAAIALLPLAIWALHGAVTERRRLCIFLAPLTMAAVLLTNWPGSIGLAMAILAYLLSRLFTKPSVRWPVVAAIGVVTYLLAIIWVPPLILASVLSNAQQSDASYFGKAQILPGVFLLAAVALLLVLFRRCRVDPWARFFLFFTLITGTVVMTWQWFGWHLLPQANRFEVEFDMAGAAALAYCLVMAFRKLPRRARIALLAIGFLLAVGQTSHYRRYALATTQSVDITKTIEFRMAVWFGTHLQGARVFAPGNVALWMNYFTDTPQLTGCCDQGVPHVAYRIAYYTVYTGQGMGAREGEESLLWLRAYGVRAVGVSGPHSTNAYKPFWNPRKFDGLLPVVWGEGDDAVYAVPSKAADPVRVVPANAVVTRTPINGMDIGPLATLVQSLEDPAMPFASFRWLNRHEAVIHTQTAPGQVVFLQISYDRGWQAEQDGVRLPVHPDGLGMMYVEPAGAGPASIHLIYDGGAEAKVVRMFFGLGLLLWAWLVLSWPLRLPAVRMTEAPGSR